MSKRQKREFKLRSFDESPHENSGETEEEKHVRILPPNRSNYPRLFDNWMIILVFSLLILFLIFILKWLTNVF